MPHSHWTVVVPVKRLDDAKTRLHCAQDGAAGRALALAFACDTVASILECPTVAMVAVVTADETVHSALPDGVRLIGEPRNEGLNAAITHACTALPPRPVAVVVSDLPSLRPDQLSRALDTAAETDFSFVPDANGSGTVMLASKAPGLLRPQFGERSAEIHESAGAARLTGAWPTLQRDVDTRADLKNAVGLGAGQHTRSALRALEDELAQVERLSSPHYPGQMQATVAVFDADKNSGSVLLDNGYTKNFGSDAFTASGLELLRLGQRVALELDQDGQISRLWIPTMPPP